MNAAKKDYVRVGLDFLRTQAVVMRARTMDEKTRDAGDELVEAVHAIKQLEEELHNAGEWLSRHDAPRERFGAKGTSVSLTLMGRLEDFLLQRQEQDSERGRVAWAWLTYRARTEELPPFTSMESILLFEQQHPRWAVHVARFGKTGHHRASECSISNCPGGLTCFNYKDRPETVAPPHADYVNCPRCNIRAADGTRSIVLPTGEVAVEMYRHCPDCRMELRLPVRLVGSG